MGRCCEEAVPGLKVLVEPTGTTLRQRAEPSLTAALPFCSPGLLQPSQPERYAWSPLESVCLLYP